MNRDEYLEGRVDDQIAWYDRKSQANQKAFKRLRVIEIIVAAFIPLLASYMGKLDYLQVVVSILGLIIIVVAGILSLYGFQENWTGYRITCETLKHEKFLFITGTEPYNVQQSFRLFVQRIESIVSKEHSNWAQYVQAEPTAIDQSNKSSKS